MSYDSGDSIKITSDHLLRDDGNNASKNGPQIRNSGKVKSAEDCKGLESITKETGCVME